MLRQELMNIEAGFAAHKLLVTQSHPTAQGVFWPITSPHQLCWADMMS